MEEVYVESETSGSLNTTGHKVWPAAEHLFKWLAASSSGGGLGGRCDSRSVGERAYGLVFRNGEERKRAKHDGVRILELGSGTGWLGLSLARNVLNLTEICLTERREGLDFLKKNVDRYVLSRKEEDKRKESVKLKPTQEEEADGLITVCECDWEEGCCDYLIPKKKSDADSRRCWDLVIGSDLIYESSGCRHLPLIWRALLESSSNDNSITTVLYCHTKRRYEDLDYQLFDMIEELGMTYKEEVENEADERSPSPPPYSEAFPEQRIAIFRISLNQ